MILSFKGEDSFVVGIEGEWGSGKTSFIEMILETLEQADAGKRPDIIKFNPWNFSSIDSLYTEFFGLLGVRLGDKKVSLGYAKKILRRIEIEPRFGWLSFGKFKGLGASLNELREAIESKLRERSTKIVMVVDDIDRLDKKETRDIFKLVKLNANFPNVIYLLAYDRPKVEEILSRDRFPGAEYLKKIVQVSFSLPKPEPSQLYSILGEELDKTLESKEAKSITKKYWDDKRWGNLFIGGFRDVFSTIRDIKRYVNTWRLDYLIVGYGEVNPIDFAGVELIRVFAPEVYAKIAENKEFFTKIEGSYFADRGRDDRDIRKKLYEEIISKAPKEIKKAVDGVCQQLFPQIKGIYTNESYPYSWQEEWRRELRVCATDMFDTYFLLSVPTGGVSQTELNALVNTLDDPASFAEGIDRLKTTQKLRTVLDRIIDHLDSFSPQQNTNLILSLFNVGGQIEDEKRGVMDIENAETKIMRLCYQALRRIDQGKRLEVLKKTSTNTSGLYTPLHFSGILINEFEKHKDKPQEDKPLLSSDKDVGKLKDLALEKIRGAVKDGSIKKNRHLAPLLIWWKKWSDDQEEVKKYLLGFLKNKKDLAFLLRAFKTSTFSQTLGDYVSVKKEKIDIKSLDDLLGAERIDRAISKLRKTTKSLTKEEREVFTLWEKSKKLAEKGGGE